MRAQGVSTRERNRRVDPVGLPGARAHQAADPEGRRAKAPSGQEATNHRSVPVLFQWRN
jgi:hypothetical protein